MAVGLVVPAYDPDVDLLERYVRDVRDRIDPATVRVELDAPDEATRRAVADMPVECNVASRRRGKGAAITAGFEALETDVYAFADADGSTSVDSLAAVIDRVVDGGADLAVGSRRHPEAAVENSQSQLRETLGDAFAWLARRALPVALYDYQCGAKAITADGWEEVRSDLYEPGFGWDVEFVAAAGKRGLVVAEVPVEWIDQPGSTVATGATALELGRTLVNVRRRRGLVRSGDRPPLVDIASEHE